MTKTITIDDVKLYDTQSLVKDTLTELKKFLISIVKRTLFFKCFSAPV